MDRCRERSRTRWGRGAGASRRRFLASLAAGGGALLGGCIDEYDAEDANWPDGSEDAWRTSFHGSLDSLDPIHPKQRLRRIAFDVGFATAQSTDDRLLVLADDVEVSADSVSMTLKPDLEWSNGDPLTATGVGRWMYMYRAGARDLAPVPEIRRGRQPRTAWEAITDVRWDGRTVTVEGVDRGPSPLSVLNAHVGRHPKRYYDRLWEAFRAEFDDEPWEDESTRRRVADLVEDNIWSPHPDYRPEGGISLESDHNGTGMRAAFSGLWYPHRAQTGLVHLTVNDAHPFADRVEFDEMIWAFREEPGVQETDLGSGAIDGAVVADVSEHVRDSLPSKYELFEGQPHTVTAITVNNEISYFRERDVRAAIMYALDLERLLEDMDLVNRRPVAIPGADLQSAQWAPSDLRRGLRSYGHDPSRAAELLEGSGFRRQGGDWRTPDGERFEIEILTTEQDPTLYYAVSAQLEEFGIKANPEIIEGASYQSRRRDGQYIATETTLSSPNAAGLPEARTSTVVRGITAGEGFPDSSFLKRSVEGAIEANDALWWVNREDDKSGMYAHRYLGFDSPDALRSITVEAPPYGEPDGPLQDWPYLYHAVMAASATDEDEKVHHTRRCTWIYNYQLPELELLVRVPQIVHDTEQWAVPEDGDRAWKYVGTGGQPGGLWAALGWGHIDRAR